MTFGQGVDLSGTLPVAAANEPVTLYSEAASSPSFVELAALLTRGPGGTWSYGVVPQIGTVYKAIWKGEVSPPVAVAVSPSIMLRERQTGRFVTHVAGATSFAGRIVRLQRLEHGVWRTVASKPLNSGSAVAVSTDPAVGPLAAPGVPSRRLQAGTGYVSAYKRSAPLPAP